MAAAPWPGRRGPQRGGERGSRRGSLAHGSGDVGPNCARTGMRVCERAWCARKIWAWCGRGRGADVTVDGDRAAAPA